MYRKYIKKALVTEVTNAFKMWTLQGTILRPPDYESGALTS